MKVQDLKVGSAIDQGEVISIKNAVEPDRVIIEVKVKDTEEVRYLRLLKDVEVKSAILVDKEAIVKQFTEKLIARLEFAEKQYGKFWTGSDPLAELEEELLDAFVYLWLGKRL